MALVSRPFQLALLALVVGIPPMDVSPCRAAEPAVWPSPPAKPLLRFEGAVRKLEDFEVAIQGPTEAPHKKLHKLKRPSGVAFDSRGRLLISDARQGVLLQVDPELGVVLVFGSGTHPKLIEPRGIAVSDAGIVYVADAGLRAVVAFEPSGAVDAVFSEGGLGEPSDVALTPDGKQLFVADSENDEVVVFDLHSRERVNSFGGRGQGVAQFFFPTAVEFDDAGNLLVVDQLNTRVQIFDSNRAFKRALSAPAGGSFSRPRDVAVDDAGRIYVSDVAQSHFQVYDSNLEPLVLVGRNGLGDGEFLAIGALAASGSSLAVLDQAGGRVQLFRILGLESTQSEKAPAVASTTAAPKTRPLEQAGSPEVEVRPAPREMPAPKLPIRPAQQPAPATPAPAIESPPPTETTSAATAPEPAPEIVEDPAAEVAQQLLERLESWAQTWSARDANGYLSHYGSGFHAEDGQAREVWAADRRRRLQVPSWIEVEIDLESTEIEGDGARTTFTQSYSSNSFSDRVRKTLYWEREDGEWRIGREVVREVLDPN